MIEKHTFPIKVFLQGSEAAFPEVLAALCPDGRLMVKDKTKEISYLFEFQTIMETPILSNFCFLYVFISGDEASFESTKGKVLKTAEIWSPMQKYGFLMLLELKGIEKAPVFGSETGIPGEITRAAEAFSSENGLFFLELGFGAQKRGLELLQKVMRIRASHLERFIIEDGDFNKENAFVNKKKPVDLSDPHKEHAYDLPLNLKTPQFTKAFFGQKQNSVKEEEKSFMAKNNEQNSFILKEKSFIKDEIVNKKEQIPLKESLKSFKEEDSPSQNPKSPYKSSIKEFVVRKEAIIPVFETSLSSRKPLLTHTNTIKPSKKSPFKPTKDLSLGTIELEIDESGPIRVPLFPDDTSFSLIERVMGLIGRQWGVQKVRKMAEILERTINGHIDSMMDYWK